VVEADVVLAEGESKEIALRFDAVPGWSNAASGAVTPVEAKRPVPASVFVGLAATGAFAVGATVTGMLALGKSNDYRDANDGHDVEAAKALSDQTKTLGIVTDVLIGAAVVSAGVTTYLFVSRPSSADHGSHVRLEPRLGRANAGLQLAGAF
jgi:hypothetical protein